MHSQKTHRKLLGFLVQMDQIHQITTQNMPNNINKCRTGWK